MVIKKIYLFTKKFLQKHYRVGMIISIFIGIIGCIGSFYLKTLASMIYHQDTNKKGKYSPPSVKNNSGFSPRVNNTLNQMKQNY